MSASQNHTSAILDVVKGQVSTAFAYAQLGVDLARLKRFSHVPGWQTADFMHANAEPAQAAQLALYGKILQDEKIESISLAPAHAALETVRGYVATGIFRPADAYRLHLRTVVEAYKLLPVFETLRRRGLIDANHKGAPPGLNVPQAAVHVMDHMIGLHRQNEIHKPQTRRLLQMALTDKP